jgi:broad specificity phosphatase PhoE
MISDKKRLILVRHGQSTSNVNKAVLSDTLNHLVSLTSKGFKDAVWAGIKLRDEYHVKAADIIYSPHLRTEQTMLQIVNFVQAITIRENFRIREIDIGNFIHDYESIRRDRAAIGKFNYRFPNGESGADLVSRVEKFLDDNLKHFSITCPTVIVTHAGTINAFRMLLENLTVSQYDNLTKPENGAIFQYFL